MQNKWFFFFIFKSSLCFINNQIDFEYNTLCKEKNENCSELHLLYNECGRIIFDLWLKLDIFFSIKVDESLYNNLYNDINIKIQSIHELLKNIKSKSSFKNHTKDTKKLLFFIKTLSKHQIVKFTEEILHNIEKCKNELIIEENI